MTEEQYTSSNRSSIDRQSIGHGEKEFTGTTILGIKLENYIVTAVDSRITTYEEDGTFKVSDDLTKLWDLHTPLMATYAGHILHCLEALAKFVEEKGRNCFSSLEVAKRLEKITRTNRFSVSSTNEISNAEIILSGFDESRFTGTTILAIKLDNYIVTAVDSRVTTYKEDGTFKVSDDLTKLWGLHTPLMVATYAGHILHCLETLAKFGEEKGRNCFSSLEEVAKRLEKITRSIIFGVSSTNEISTAEIILSGFDESRKPQIFGVSSADEINTVSGIDYLVTGGGSVYATPVLEGGYNSTMSMDDGVELARKAIYWAVTNDIHRGDVSICLVSPWGSMVVWTGDVMAYYKPDYTLADFGYNVYDGRIEDQPEDMDVDN